MIGIVREFHKYVPMMEYEKDVYVPSIDKSVQIVAGSAHMIQFAGDQKTAARARGAQLAKVHAATPSRRLMGLVPAVADWHTKVKLLHVSVVILHRWVTLMNVFNIYIGDLEVLLLVPISF